ncbi:hypothetical protein K2173_001450 [Erythroxylum novogranatense]|uniref:Uncharacterized protein n=1 Tax=Erythroxylum novogranatense TaxID=1862640 RepID=A0AAV8T915_9ROSI|nr:hypothetical protein K2173_001450 [Erythroxylum novogranatense]
MLDSKPCRTPMATAPTLSRSRGEVLPSSKEYRQMVGALQYLTLTRPDIAFAVNKLAQFLHCATDIHWQACKWLLHFLQGTSNNGLWLHSDWAGCPNDRRFTSGYLVYFGGNLIFWSNKKQPTIARSNTESEYKALANATAKLMWLRTLLREIGYLPLQLATLWCDNVSVIYLTSNPVFHALTKHVEIDYHFIRDQIRQATVQIRFTKSSYQIVDILTKLLGHILFHHICASFAYGNPMLRLRGVVPDMDIVYVFMECTINSSFSIYLLIVIIILDIS